jgi:uncharacterized protein involved in outer membrane biogenesis
VGLEFRPGMIQTLSPDIARPAEPAARSKPWLRGLLTWTVSLLVLVLALDAIGSLLVRRDRVKQRLNARLAAAFGRKVDVDAYSFNLWGGPTLEADGVRVAEDPRFGHEYFLRADSIAVRLRWLSLLRGRFELGSLALAGPTLNVDTNAAGDWNLAEWLGHPTPMAANSIGPVRTAFVPRFLAIDVEDGRVNFKSGDDKLPFAFIDVVGTIEADGPERWRLDLQAAPWRAAEPLQQAGTIHLAGSVGGTSSALRPASLQMSWTAASASDFLRLIDGDDSGIRGTAAIVLNAQTAANGWAIEGQAQLGELHRWDLPVQGDVPSLSLSARMSLDVPASTLEIIDASIEAPHSNVRGAGRISWAAGNETKSASPSNPLDLTIESSTIDAADLLSWLRAFRSNIPVGVTATGILQARGKISGWPAQVTRAAIDTSAIELSGGPMATPLHIGTAEISYGTGGFAMTPATIGIGSGKNATGSFRAEIVPAPKRSAHRDATVANGELYLAGSADDAGDVSAVASAFGWNVARGWQLAGPMRCDLHWTGSAWPWKVAPVGSMSIGGTGDSAASLRAAFLNLPVDGLDFRIDWKPGARQVTLSSAHAFGAHWSGTFARSDSAPEWQFALSADKLDAADLDRWLNPRWRESFIDRVLPFLNSRAPSNAVPESLHGSGRLSINQLRATPFVLQGLAGDLTVDGRDLTLDNVLARLAGGEVVGSFEANLVATSDYDAHARFSGVDFGALAEGDHPEAAAFGGKASGEVEFSMQGTSRGDFADSLQCQGALDVRNAAWRGIALAESLQDAKTVAGDSAFSEASGKFACADGAVALTDIVLTGAHGEIDGSGRVDFARNLDLQMRGVRGEPGAVGPVEDASGLAEKSASVTGTLDAPEISHPAPGRRPR